MNARHKRGQEVIQVALFCDFSSIHRLGLITKSKFKRAFPGLTKPIQNELNDLVSRMFLLPALIVEIQG
jgi:hypothetical protein